MDDCDRVQRAEKSCWAQLGTLEPCNYATLPAAPLGGPRPQIANVACEQTPKGKEAHYPHPISSASGRAPNKKGKKKAAIV